MFKFGDTVWDRERKEFRTVVSGETLGLVKTVFGGFRCDIHEGMLGQFTVVDQLLPYWNKDDTDFMIEYVATWKEKTP